MGLELTGQAVAVGALPFAGRNTTHASGNPGAW